VKNDWQKYQFQIPLALPYLSGKEWEYVKNCLDTNWITSAGAYIEQFEQKIKDFTGAKYCVAVASGTAALHLALQAVGVKANTCVLLPNLSFVASANAVYYCNAEPVFVDVRRDTWQIDEKLLEYFLEKECYQGQEGTFLKRTRQKISAILPVHCLGNMPAMDKILALAQTYQIPVVEDAAEALGSRFEQKHAGTLGNVGIFSFNGNKIVTTANGGAIVTDDETIARQVRHRANQAKTDTHEYFHDEIGYNYRLPNVLAAIGLAQMEQIDFFLQQKKIINNAYRKHLQEVAVFQEIMPNVEPNFWLFTALFENSKQIAQKLAEHNIQTRKLWYPLNRLPMYKNALYIHEADVTWQIYEKSLSLPSAVSLSEEQIEKITAILSEAYAQP
jgi:aminotransferase in exopolysaccharide biosynthesis